MYGAHRFAMFVMLPLTVSTPACEYRLYLMLQQVLGSPGSMREKHEVVEFSSHLNSSQRASALEQLRTGVCVCMCARVCVCVCVRVNFSPQIDALGVVHPAHCNLCKRQEGRAKVLVASDAMTRGMDVDNVQNIVNYDAPVYAKTYVHRCASMAA
eukprot:1159859-Pelagomonas_calceolata.AAC.6